MGIDVVWQNERGVEKDRVNDEHNRLSLLVLAIPLDEFVCLRFLDPYGDTYFNQQQLPVLLEELRKVSENISEEQFQTSHSDYVTRAKQAGWQESVIKELESKQGFRQIESVREHLEKVIKLIKRGTGNTHTYVRFVGD